jgi:hypothetical protein
MHRTRSGRRIELTVRDLEVFRTLEHYRYLRSTYLHAFVGGASLTRFKERVGDLFHEGFIDRPSQQWQFADGRHSPVVHERGERGARALRERGLALCAPRTFLKQAAHQQFAHSVAVCETLASIELFASQTSLRFIPWPEILARASRGSNTLPIRFTSTTPSGTVLPDGIFGLEYRLGEKRSYRFFALEVDRGTMPISRTNARQTSYLAKLAVYADFIGRQLYKSQLGIPNLFVLTVTKSSERLSNVIREFSADATVGARFLFKAAPIGTKASQTPMPQLLLDPWERQDHERLRIDEP